MKPWHDTRKSRENFRRPVEAFEKCMVDEKTETSERTQMLIGIIIWILSVVSITAITIYSYLNLDGDNITTEEHP